LCISFFGNRKLAILIEIALASSADFELASGLDRELLSSGGSHDCNMYRLDIASTHFQTGEQGL